MAGPQDPAAAGGGQLRAGYADREQVIEALKTAFVHGRLTKAELDTRAPQALTARTRADLAALTADIPPAVPAAGSARPLAPARRRPLVRAAVRSGICLAFAAAAVWAAFILDPGPRAGDPGSSGGPGVGWCFVLAIYAVIAAVCIMGVGVAKSKEQRRSRRQLPPRPGPDGQALEAGQHGGTGHDPVPPGRHTDQTRADLGCLTDQITVNGAAQPLLWDNQGGLARMIRELLGRSLFLAGRRTTHHLRTGYRERVEAQTPPPELVTASRRHLTERYASGVDRLLWNREKRCLPDLTAIELVTDATLAGLADALDLGAALVLVHAGRLHLDGLEYEIFQGAHAAGMRREALAAILGLPDAAAVSERQQWLKGRHALPRAEAEQILPDGPGHAEAAARAGRRAAQAANRAAEVARRREELIRLRLPGRDPRTDHPEQAVARAHEARLLVDEAAERAALGLRRAAAALDHYAIRCTELSVAADSDQARGLRRKADEYRQAASRYREMAAHYGDRGGNRDR